MEQEMEMVPTEKTGLTKQKKIIIAIVACILAAAIVVGAVFGILCLVAKNKVVGVWESETIYLSTYGGNCKRVMSIADDGSFVCVGIRLSDNRIVFTEVGTWTMKGRSAILVEKGEVAKATYTYHITGKLSNGDTKYVRIDD